MYAHPENGFEVATTRDTATDAAGAYLMNLRHAEQWRQLAACAGMPSTMFNPETWNKKNRVEARAVCIRCPVRKACLDYAIGQHEEYGMYGGLTPRQRKQHLQTRKEKAST